MNETVKIYRRGNKTHQFIPAKNIGRLTVDTIVGRRGKKKKSRFFIFARSCPGIVAARPQQQINQKWPANFSSTSNLRSERDTF